MWVHLVMEVKDGTALYYKDGKLVGQYKVEKLFSKKPYEVWFLESEKEGK